MGLSVAIAGRAAMRAANCCACSTRHPELSVEVVTASSNAGELVTSVHPHLPQLRGSGLRGRPTPPAWPAPTWCSSRCRTGNRPPSRRSCPATSSSSISAPTSGCATPRSVGAVLRRPHAGTWTYGLPELPGARGRHRGEPADRQPRLLRHRDHARARATARCRLAEPDDIVVVAASGTTGAGRGMKQHLMASRGHGFAVAVQGRWHPPAHARDRAKPVGRRRAGRCRCRSRPCSRRCRGESWPPAPPRRSPAPALPIVRAAFERLRRPSRSCSLLPDGRVAADRCDPRLELRSPAGRARRARRPHRRRLGARQPDQRRGRSGACRTPTSRSASTRRRRCRSIGVTP